MSAPECAVQGGRLIHRIVMVVRGGGAALHTTLFDGIFVQDGQRFDREQPGEQFQGAQATSLLVSGHGAETNFKCVAGRLPAATGWQTVLPRLMGTPVTNR